MATAFGQTAHKWRGRDWSQERSDFKIHSFQLSNNKKQTTQFRNGQRIWIDISPKWYTNGQQAYEKMLNITNHYRNANQNHHEISLRIHQDVYYKKKRKHKESLYMELTRENKAEAHSWQWYVAFLINNISKSYFPLEIHIKEGARWLEYFLLLVLSEEELFYVPYRDDSVIFLFYLSTNPFIHPFIYPWIYVFMNLCISLFSLFLYYAKSQGLK